MCIVCTHREPPFLPRQGGGVSRRSSRDEGGGANKRNRQNPSSQRETGGRRQHPCPPRGDRVRASRPPSPGKTITPPPSKTLLKIPTQKHFYPSPLENNFTPWMMIDDDG